MNYVICIALTYIFVKYVEPRLEILTEVFSHKQGYKVSKIGNKKTQNECEIS